MTVSPNYRPLYRQIKELILKSLDDGEWLSGDMIPSEAVLAKRYQVSQGTVRKAIDEMSAENLLVRRQGKGTFVATHNDPQQFYRFLRLRPDDGPLEHLKSICSVCEQCAATDEVAAHLEINPQDWVIHIKRTLCSQMRPVVYDDIYLVAEMFPGISSTELALPGQSLYTIFERQFGVRMIRASEKLRAVAADAEVAEKLKQTVGTPLLSVERIAYTYGDRPVEWRKGLYLTDQNHYANELF